MCTVDGTRVRYAIDGGSRDLDSTVKSRRRMIRKMITDLDKIGNEVDSLFDELVCVFLLRVYRFAGHTRTHTKPTHKKFRSLTQFVLCRVIRKFIVNILVFFKEDKVNYGLKSRFG